MNTKKWKLSIIGVQKGYGQEEKSEVHTTADYYCKGEKHYLFYSEYTEEGTEIKNRLTICPNQVELRKSGQGNSVLCFEEGRLRKCLYHSPAGLLDMVSDTKEIRFHKKEGKLKLEIRYSLEMNEMLMSEYHLTVKAKEVGGF